jgi:phenylalanyl-tRNA synthetase beta chain
MPVVTLYKHRLENLVGKGIDEIKAMLPYIALDIEEEGNDYIKVEYNPNRPDYSTDYGIARALRGLMDIEIGLPRIEVKKSSIRFIVDDSVKGIRPYIVALLAVNGRLDGEDVRQLISMQEDLHIGLGRRRKKASIGLHNYDKVKEPFYYTTVDDSFRFIPLNYSSEMSIKDILASTDVGKEYSHLLSNADRYPIIKDSYGNILSFPPIINSNLTRIDESTKNILVEVTATDINTAQDVLAVIAVTLRDMGFTIESVDIYTNSKILTTPDMSNRSMSIDINYANSILGIDLSADEIARCLKRCRLDASYNSNSNTIICTIPRYRIDIISEIDLVEDIAIGYNVSLLEPRYPRLKAMGSKDKTLGILDHARDVLIGLGMLEVINFSLVSYELQYKMVNRDIGSSKVLMVKESKSKEHEVLRDMLLPSLLDVLAKNIHEPYPQRLFEIGKVFIYDCSYIKEHYNVACVIADAHTDYTEAKSYLQAFLKHLFGYDVVTEPIEDAFYEHGRAASIIVNNISIGNIGEISKSILNNFRIRVNVSAFELDLSKLLGIEYSI